MVVQDVVAGGGGELLSRCFVSAASLATLEGHISASLMTPQLQVTSVTHLCLCNGRGACCTCVCAGIAGRRPAHRCFQGLDEHR